MEAQGGEERAKYGNQLIKEYSEKLTKELGKGYGITNLKRMRQFYLIVEKGAPMAHQLTWSHYVEILPIKNIDKIKYYINIAKKFSLSKRELRESIKSNEYERIGKKCELNNLKVDSLIKEPILIKVKSIPEKINEYILHNLILENMGDFLRELGEGFSYIDHEVKIKICDNYHRIDFLLFNYIFDCFVVVELKTTEFKAEHAGQTIKYMNYIDKNFRKPYHDKTVGIIVCKKNNKYILEYIGFDKLFVSSYELECLNK